MFKEHGAEARYLLCLDDAAASGKASFEVTAPVADTSEAAAAAESAFFRPPSSSSQPLGAADPRLGGSTEAASVAVYAPFHGGGARGTAEEGSGLSGGAGFQSGTSGAGRQRRRRLMTKGGESVKQNVTLPKISAFGGASTDDEGDDERNNEGDFIEGRLHERRLNSAGWPYKLVVYDVSGAVSVVQFKTHLNRLKSAHCSSSRFLDKVVVQERWKNQWVGAPRGLCHVSLKSRMACSVSNAMAPHVHSRASFCVLNLMGFE